MKITDFRQQLNVETTRNIEKKVKRGHKKWGWGLEFCYKLVMMLNNHSHFTLDHQVYGMT